LRAGTPGFFGGGGFYTAADLFLCKQTFKIAKLFFMPAVRPPFSYFAAYH
jgi:hypothetical protein